MNQRLIELYRSCRPKEALASQDAHGSADVLLGTEVAKFAELIVRECMNICAEREEDIRTRIRDERQAATAYMCRAYIKQHFGVEE